MKLSRRVGRFVYMYHWSPHALTSLVIRKYFVERLDFRCCCCIFPGVSRCVTCLVVFVYVCCCLCSGGWFLRGVKELYAVSSKPSMLPSSGGLQSSTLYGILAQGLIERYVVVVVVVGTRFTGVPYAV
jgi:hypothetical protein